jgi:hypothetical protein
MNDTPDRLFSPEEVEALIPKLTEVVERLRRAHEEVTTLRERQQAEQQRLAMSGGGLLDQARWRDDAARLERATKEAQQAVDDIHGTGGVPKDAALGLVDFPHLRDGRVVNLCWKYPEREIRFWHGMDEGYASRKPL